MNRMNTKTRAIGTQDCRSRRYVRSYSTTHLQVQFTIIDVAQRGSITLKQFLVTASYQAPSTPEAEPPSLLEAGGTIWLPPTERTSGLEPGRCSQNHRTVRNHMHPGNRQAIQNNDAH